MTTINTNYQNLIKNIEFLQNNEKQLYSDLDTLPANTGLERQKLIIDKINNMAETRINLFKNLSVINSLFSNNITSESATLQAKTKLLQTMEEELNRRKTQIRKDKNINIKNLRLTEINTYYSEKYKAYFGIFKKIVYICIALLIVTVLRQRYLINSNISHLLAIIVIVIGVFFIIPPLLDLYARNNMVFSEYDFTFDPNNIQNPPIGDDEHDTSYIDIEKYKKDLQLLAEGDCLGSSCCGPGLEYDTKMEQCIISG